MIKIQRLFAKNSQYVLLVLSGTFLYNVNYDPSGIFRTLIRTIFDRGIFQRHAVWHMLLSLKGKDGPL